jgi:hypothetical protein
MTPVLLLRIAAIIGLLFVVGHTLGAPWTPATAGSLQAVVESMKTLHFAAMGSQRSYFDFYTGFGWSLSIFMLALALILWQLATLAKADARRLRGLMLSLALAYLAEAAVAWKFLFAVPMLMSAVEAACIAAAWVLAGRGGTGQTSA